MTATSPSPGGLVAYVLDDEDRTRRARSLLYTVAIILLEVAAILVYSPLVAALIGSSLGIPATVATAIRRQRRERSGLDQQPLQQ